MSRVKKATGTVNGAARRGGVPSFGAADGVGTVRVAVYIRISTDEEHQPFSLEAQEAKLRGYVDTQPGWVLVGDPYRDEQSGATLERPGLQRALAAGRAGRFDVLLVYRVDRLSRSLRGLVTILDELDEAKVSFRSATEPFDTSTAVGRMLVQMLGVFAQFERETIIDRVINGMERKAAKGEWCGGYRPHGYELDKATGLLAVIESEAAVVEIIFDLYVHKRMGSRAVAVELNKRGYRTKAGQPWSGQTVLVVLRNRVYLGEIYFRGQWYRAQPPNTPHPAIIDVELFGQAEQIMIARGEDHTRRAGNSSDYTLAGRITCTHCGKRYLGTGAGGNRYKYRYYTCFTRQRYGPQSCDADRLPAEQLEAAILTAMLDTYTHTDLFTRALQAHHAHRDTTRDQHEHERAAIDTQLTSIETKIDRYLTAFEDGALNQDTCGERIRNLARRAAQLRDRRAELSDLLDNIPQPPTDQELAALRDRISHAIQTGIPAVVKQLVEALVHDIHVTGRHHIQPYFRMPQTAQTLDWRSRVRTTHEMVPPAGFEPAAGGLEGRCSVR